MMCAYNKINGDGSCDSPTMLTTVLKGQLPGASRPAGHPTAARSRAKFALSIPGSGMLAC